LVLALQIKRMECPMWQKTGSCPFGEDCHYGHGETGNDSTGLVFFYHIILLFCFGLFNYKKSVFQFS